MKPNSTKPAGVLLAASLLLAASCTLSAQTSSSTAIHRVHHPAVHKAAPCPPSEPAPAVPAGLPPAPGPVGTAFALRYVDITPGTGAPVETGDYLTVHYTGWLASTGAKFDSSLDRGTPFQFEQGIHRVIPGWDLGFAGMRVGGKRRLFIPYQLAYGEQGQPPVIPPKSDLIFDVEVLAASATPPDEEPSAPPAALPHPGGTPQR